MPTEYFEVGGDADGLGLAAAGGVKSALQFQQAAVQQLPQVLPHGGQAEERFWATSCLETGSRNCIYSGIRGCGSVGGVRRYCKKP